MNRTQCSKLDLLALVCNTPFYITYFSCFIYKCIKLQK